MAGKRTAGNKILKVKIKKSKKKRILVSPCLRLEPRHTPSPSKKKRGSQVKLCESGESSVCFEGNELEKNLSQQEAISEGNSGIRSRFEEQKNKKDDAASFIAEEESMSYKAASSETQSPRKNTEIELNSYFKQMTEQQEQRMKGKPGFKGGIDWNDRERMDLAIGLQTYGFSDIKKIADCVKTKNENEIRQFLKLRRGEAFSETNAKKRYRQGNSWSTLCPEYVATWPNIRKWRKMAYGQMLLYTRSKDYSKPVISSLCKKFYEEEEEPVDPQVINVKLIYKYMMCCMSGAIPPQLPPKESALVLDLLREVRLMPIAYDFEEERKFLQDFRSATTFKPFQIKDEFKKRYKKVPDDVFAPNTIAVPEEIFLDLSRHKKLTQSFSPLVTPVWMLQKEQEVLEKYAEESNVYVD